jgi:DNA mismatch repair ATPase MutS
LHLVEQNKKEFTSISEIRQIESLLQLLESKLHDFHQILPRLDRRRGLVNFSGNILKTLLGTATIADIKQLHDTLNDLQLQNSDVTHSLYNQLTYVKELGTATEVNAEATANLSSIVKDNIIQSHDKFQELTRELMWLNNTVYAQS